MGFDIRLAALTSQNFNGPRNTTTQRQGFKIMYSQNGPNPPRPTQQTNRAHKKHISHTHTHNLPRFWTHHNNEGKAVRKPQASSPPFLDLRLRELRFDPRLFALRLAERFAFLLPPFLADAFLREERLFGAMALPTQRTYGCGTTASSI